MILLSQAINMWSKKNKENALQLLQHFGDIDEIITYIDKMTYCYQIDDDTYKIDGKYYIHYNKKRLSIHKIDDILYCYQSKGHHIPHNYVVGVILKSAVSVEFDSFDINSTLAVYDFFCRVLPNIEQQPFSPYSFETVGLFRRIKVCNEKLVHYRKHKPLFAKAEKEKVYYETDVSNLIWCHQVHYIPDEGSDGFDVHMAFRDGKYIIFQINDNTFPLGCATAFELILNLKKNVPHLLYGTNKEYDKIFKKNPEELYALAIQKCDK